MNYKTDQEKFWAGEFGDEYTIRNNVAELIAIRTHAFAKIFSKTERINSALEFGANIGDNLLAIRNLIPSCSFSAIEINSKAAEILKSIPNTTVHLGSIFDFTPQDIGKHDITFTCHVLIHINPEMLPKVYSRMYDCSGKYILIKEYFNPTPVVVNYRGNTERLFKRDFSGEMMDLYPDLELIDYGFQYHRDYNFPEDDSTWFLLKKTK
jgi:pseudaminic acid biosynthesis-associated methylase